MAQRRRQRGLLGAYLGHGLADNSRHERTAPDSLILLFTLGNTRCQPFSTDWFFSDTEGVTGSNPVAPTTVVAGQGPVRARPTALLTCRGRAAAAVCSPPNRMGSPGPTTQDHHQPNDHPAWSPPPLSSPWSGTMPATCPGCTCGRDWVSTCWFSCSAANRPAPGAGPAPVSARRRGGAAACAPAMGRPRSGVDPRASHPRPTPAPSLPFRPHAGSRPRRPRTTAAHRTHAPNQDGPPHRAPDPARCGQRAAEPRTPKARPSGHLDCAGRMGHRTHGHRTSA